MIALVAAIVREILSLLVSMPSTVGRVQSGPNRLEPTPKDKVLERARRAGLLALMVCLVGCGQTEVVVCRLFPLEEWPGGFPILAQGSVRVMLPDGTIGEIKDAGGLMVMHVADAKVAFGNLADSRPTR